MESFKTPVGAGGEQTHLDKWEYWNWWTARRFVTGTVWKRSS